MTPVFPPAFKRPSGRALAAALLGMFTAAAVPALHAQEFPTKPVRVVTPFPAGSGPEVALRLVADKLSRIWGKPVIVDNRPGASGFIAIEAVKRAAPDGHELLQMDNAQMAAQPFLFKKLPYDLLRDFEPVTPILRNYFFVTVPAGSRYKTMGDLSAAAKAGPGQVNYGSWFVGSPGHIGAAMLETSTATKMTHVPYKEMLNFMWPWATRKWTGRLAAPPAQAPCSAPARRVTWRWPRPNAWRAFRMCPRWPNRAGPRALS